MSPFGFVINAMPALVRAPSFESVAICSTRAPGHTLLMLGFTSALVSLIAIISDFTYQVEQLLFVGPYPIYVPRHQPNPPFYSRR